MASWKTSKVAAYMLLLLFMVESVLSQMSPQYFNIAEKKKVTVNATCGEGYTNQKHYFCKLVGYDTYLHTGSQATSTIKDGQVRTVYVRGAHFKKNLIRFGWVMDISNNFS